MQEARYRELVAEPLAPVSPVAPCPELQVAFFEIHSISCLFELETLFRWLCDDVIVARCVIAEYI